MALYFFHLFDGDELIDDTGTELDSIGDARLYMLTIAKIWIEREEHQDAYWSLEARDENENIVGMLRFGVLPTNGGSA